MGVIPTDNRFNTTSVKNRWNFIKSEFEQLGVTVLSYASDGDSRYFSAMKQNVNFGTVTTVFGHQCPLDLFGSDDIYYQDPPHTVKNMKNKLKDPASDLKMGFYNVTVNHLGNLLNNPQVPKNQHLLNECDISNNDPMDWQSVYKISNENLLKLLSMNVEKSQGTVEFLRILRMLLEAFVNKETPVLKRLYNAFFSVFVFRYWKSWILLNNHVKLTENFITAETYFATELNAFMLLKLIMLCRDKFGKHFFIVYLMNSQICEKLFRILRSNTSNLSTMLNFSPLELLERLKKIQLQAELINDFQHIFNFGQNLTDERTQHFIEEMPLDKELEKTISQASREATKVAQNLGFYVEDRQFEKCKMYPTPDSNIAQDQDYKISLPLVPNNRNFIFQNINFIEEITGNLYQIHKFLRE